MPNFALGQNIGKPTILDLCTFLEIHPIFASWPTPPSYLGSVPVNGKPIPVGAVILHQNPRLPWYFARQKWSLRTANLITAVVWEISATLINNVQLRLNNRAPFLHLLLDC